MNICGIKNSAGRNKIDVIVVTMKSALRVLGYLCFTMTLLEMVYLFFLHNGMSLERGYIFFTLKTHLRGSAYFTHLL